MKLTRRDFVKATAAGGVGIAALGWPRRAWAAAFAQSPGLMKFPDGHKLRLFGIDIPLATATQTGYGPGGADYYEIAMRQYQDILHPGLGPTTLRGYTNAANKGTQKHLEGAILAQTGHAGSGEVVQPASREPPASGRPQPGQPICGFRRDARERPCRTAPARRPRAVAERRRAVPLVFDDR